MSSNENWKKRFPIYGYIWEIKRHMSINFVAGRKVDTDHNSISLAVSVLEATNERSHESITKIGKWQNWDTLTSTLIDHHLWNFPWERYGWLISWVEFLRMKYKGDKKIFLDEENFLQC